MKRMRLSTRERWRLKRFKRKAREAETRINRAIIKRMHDIQRDPELMVSIDREADDDAKRILKEGMEGYKKDMLASLGRNKQHMY